MNQPDREEQEEEQNTEAVDTLMSWSEIAQGEKMVGTVHEFIATKTAGRTSGSGREQAADAGLGLVMHTLWMASSVVSSVAPALKCSTKAQKTRTSECDSQVEPEIRGAPEEPLHGYAGAVIGGEQSEHNYEGNSEGNEVDSYWQWQEEEWTLEGYQQLRG